MRAMEKGREIVARLQPYSSVSAAKSTPEEAKEPCTSSIVQKPRATMTQP
jgi:hypothetical protein